MRKVFLGTGLLMAGMLLSAAVVTGQDKKDPPAKPKGTLPANYGKLGLSEEQKAKIHQISAEYKGKIDDLNKQVAEMKAKQKKAFEAVLTDSQVEQLRKLQTGEGAEKKPDGKPGEKPAEKPNDK
jgi:hypothetical protein